MNEEHSTLMDREQGSNLEPRTSNLERGGCGLVVRGSKFKVQGSGFRAPRHRAFTLIELLVVIAIIGVLAAIIFPAGAAVKRKATIKRVEGELAQLANAIDSYKIDKGFYPPDNSANKNAANENVLYFNLNTTAVTNSLYYELAGVEVINAANNRNLRYETLDRGEQVWMADLSPFGVGGIMNASTGGETSVAKNYLQTFKPAQHSELPSGLKIMSTVVKGPTAPDNGPSRFSYVSSSRWQRNPQTFDLWVDVIVGGKTNRISNWSDQPEIVSY